MDKIMIFDRQTLAWLNDKNWFKKMDEMYSSTVSERAELPTYTAPIIMTNRDGKGKLIKEFYGWGHEKWHHSVNLKDNICKCERCLGISDNWECMLVQEIRTFRRMKK